MDRAWLCGGCARVEARGRRGVARPVGPGRKGQTVGRRVWGGPEDDPGVPGPRPLPAAYPRSRYSVPARYVGESVVIRELLASYEILHQGTVITAPSLHRMRPRGGPRPEHLSSDRRGERREGSHMTTPQLEHLSTQYQRLRLHRVDAELTTLFKHAARKDMSYADFLGCPARPGAAGLSRRNTRRCEFLIGAVPKPKFIKELSERTLHRRRRERTAPRPARGQQDARTWQLR